VCVLHLPYSDPSTLPSDVPDHIRSSKAYVLPRDMNAFLCQLLDIKKRALCKCLPLPVVVPQVGVEIEA
jgi:hypothetical protein